MTQVVQYLLQCIFVPNIQYLTQKIPNRAMAIQERKKEKNIKTIKIISLKQL